MELADRTAIVTAGGSGIGEGIAVAFAREGANIVVMDRNADDAEAVAQRVKSIGGTSLAFHGSITTKSDIDALVVATLRQFGAIDILVNNAGIEAPAFPIQDLPEQQWDQVFAFNLKAVFLCCQAVIPTMFNQDKGKIINIASAAAIGTTFFGSVEYTASRHGLMGLTNHLAWELADHHINVNAICPGGLLAPSLDERASALSRDKIAKRPVPFGRFCTIDEIAQVAVFLACDRSNMITGQLLVIEGGLQTGCGEDLRSIARKHPDGESAPVHD